MIDSTSIRWGFRCQKIALFHTLVLTQMPTPVSIDALFQEGLGSRGCIYFCKSNGGASCKKKNVSSKSLIQYLVPHLDFAVLQRATIVAGRASDGGGCYYLGPGAGRGAASGPAASDFCFAFPPRV